VEEYKPDCEIIADRIRELMEAMISAMEGKTEADLDERFKRDLVTFVRYVAVVLKVQSGGLCLPSTGTWKKFSKL
jgi:hypothetical protein